MLGARHGGARPRRRRVGRLLAIYRSWAFDLCCKLRLSTLNIANETSTKVRDFSDHRTETSKKR
jgi:hypothetical protein